jgi:lipoyl(octanoyl) transferase
VINLGLTNYAEAFEIQAQRVSEIRGENAISTLFITEHHPVLTLGSNFHEENLRLSLPEYAERGIEIHRTNRGGDVTFHGPGQLVAYPVFDLVLLKQDLHWWLRMIEEIVMAACAEIGLEPRRFPPHTGVWVGDRKLCAIGIAVRKWVSMHGLAININNDLSYFETIVPCGIADYGVTSLAQELGRDLSLTDFAPVLVRAFRQVLRSGSALV